MSDSVSDNTSDDEKSTDLTQLSELSKRAREETLAGSPLSEKSAGSSIIEDPQDFAISESLSGALPSIEGLDDLLEPLAPTSPGVEPDTFTFRSDDAIAGLPPIDPEIRKLAEGGTDPVADVPAAEKTEREEPPPPMVAAIAAELATPPPSAMEEMRDYSNRVAPNSSAAAETPFSLLIQGALKTHEREALVQILSRENLGIREVELEPQFTAGKILIPRISEYAGVLIVQTLRNSGAKMRLGPSEQIFASQEAKEDSALIFPPESGTELLFTEDGRHPAERVVISPADHLPGRRVQEILDVLHGSMNLKASQVAHPQSPVFQDALDRLKLQLKLQAHHRGADALLSFAYQLIPLEGASIYKLVVQADAVRTHVDGPLSDVPEDLSD